MDQRVLWFLFCLVLLLWVSLVWCPCQNHVRGKYAAYRNWPDTPLVLKRVVWPASLHTMHKAYPQEPLLLDLRHMTLHSQNIDTLQTLLFDKMPYEYTPVEWKAVEKQYRKLSVFKDQAVLDPEEVCHFIRRRMRVQPWRVSPTKPHYEYVSRAQLQRSGISQMIDTSLAVKHPDYYLFKLWFNPRGYTTYLHDDNCENIVYQVAGRKRWLLISPRHMAACQREAQPNNNNNYHYGVKDPSKTPVDGVSVTEVIMEPGQALYIPRRYLHLVESLDDSVMLSCLFRPTFWN